MEESYTRPWPRTTPPPQQQLPNSKQPKHERETPPGVRGVEIPLVLARCVARVAGRVLNNDIRRTTSPRSNLPSHSYFRSPTQHRLLTLSRPLGHWTPHAAPHQSHPLSFHVPFRTPHILCSGTSHTGRYRHVHSQTHQPPDTDRNSTAPDRYRLIGNREIKAAHRHGRAESRSATGRQQQCEQANHASSTA